MNFPIINWIFLLLLVKFGDCNSVIVKKCCDTNERFNFSGKFCVSSPNNLKFVVPRIFLDHNETNWQTQEGTFEITVIPEFCEGKAYRDERYKVTQSGKLVKYIRDNKNYYDHFNDFCVDADNESGENIAIICKNWENLKKCCPLHHHFIKSNETFQCHENNGTIFHNDVTEIYFGNYLRKPNIKFTVLEENDFKNYKLIADFSGFDPFKEFQGFCVEKFEGKWIKMLKIEGITRQTVTVSGILGVLSLISTLFTIIVYLRSNKRQQTNIRILILYAVCLLTVFILKILLKFGNFLFLTFWKDMILALSFYALNSVWLETVFAISSDKTSCLNFVGKLFMPIPGFVIIFLIIYQIQHEISEFCGIFSKVSKIIEIF